MATTAKTTRGGGSSNNSNSDGYPFPEFYNFPPFFTIQPVLTTREKQLALWRELILRYHTDLKIKSMLVHDCPLWSNPSIQRHLKADEIQIVVTDFVAHGHGEWNDTTAAASSNNNSNKGSAVGRTSVRILWRQPEQLATDIYHWAETNGLIGTVVTLYELHSGEDVHGMSFQGADEDLLRRAIRILQDRGKCALFQGDTSEEDGVKFS